MSDSDSDLFTEDVTPEHRPGPGQRLRMARERAGLSLEAVAERLHLDEDIVEAIENEDSSRLPEPVFTRGYVRNYARLVGLSAEEILDGSAESRPASGPKPALRQFNAQLKAQKIRGGHGFGRAILWLIVIALIALLVAWWRGHLPISIPVPTLGSPSETALPLETGHAEPPVPGVPSLPVLPEAAPAMPAAPLPDRGGSEQVPAGGNDGESSEAGARDRVPGPATAVSPGDAGDAGGGAPGENSGAPVAGDPAGVVFEFSAPCWVDVRDADGQKVLYGGIGSGERHVLGGRPPYRVVLGDTDAVTIIVDGRPVPAPAPADGRKVGRFVLDPEGQQVVSTGTSQ